MRFRIASLFLVLCLTLIALPVSAETYNTYICEEQGFSFEYDPTYTVGWVEGNGAVIFTGEADNLPYALVWRIEKDDAEGKSAEDYIAWYTQSMRELYGDRLLSVDETFSVQLNSGESVPGACYIYDDNGAAVVVIVYFHMANDSLRQYSVKFYQESDDAQKVIGAMACAMNSFRLTDGSGAPSRTSPADTQTGNAQKGSAPAGSMQLTGREIRSADGVLIGRCVVPADFGVDSNMKPEGSSLGNPMRVEITAGSADGRTMYAYRSACDYIQILNHPITVHQDGVMDLDTLTPMLRFMNAEDYADQVILSMFPGYEIALQSQAERSAELQAFEQQLLADYWALMQSSAAGIAGLSLDDGYYGSAERCYRFNYGGEDYMAAVAVAVRGYQFTWESYGIYENIVSTSISWGAPATYIYIAPAAEYDAGRAGFDAFMLNTSVSDQFMRANEAMSNQIRESVLQSRSLSSASSYCWSNLSSAIEPGESYEDRFTDYIFDQNDYTTSGGEHIKVPTSFDYVYEDGDGNVFASNTAPDYGMHLLDPN